MNAPPRKPIKTGNVEISPTEFSKLPIKETEPRHPPRTTLYWIPGLDTPCDYDVVSFSSKCIEVPMMSVEEHDQIIASRVAEERALVWEEASQEAAGYSHVLPGRFLNYAKEAREGQND